MECIIPGNNLKVLGKTLQSLSKVGDELFMECTKERLCFTTLNISRTVCARFYFSDTFFSSYQVDNDSDNNTLSCKVQMKIILPLFKGQLEKKLEYLKLEYEADSDFLIIKMKYKCDDIVMLHNVRLMDNEMLSVGISSDTGRNKISATGSFLNQLLTMFNLTDDEITLDISRSKVIVRNYCVGAPSRPKMIRSQVSVDSTEFTAYKIVKETVVNFALKPLRTVIQFAEVFNLTVELNFEQGGSPLSLILRDPTFELDFLVATLNPNTDATSSVATTSSACSSNHDRSAAMLSNNDKENNTGRPAIDSDDLNAVQSDNDNWTKDGSFADLLKDKNDRSPTKTLTQPLSKKAKLVFGRCYDATFSETVLGDVLAQNSDSE